MNNNPTIRVCIKLKQYNEAFKRSGIENEKDFNCSIGLISEENVEEDLEEDIGEDDPFINIVKNKVKSYIPYIIMGGIPVGPCKELTIIDSKLYDYSKIKYELYND